MNSDQKGLQGPRQPREVSPEVLACDNALHSRMQLLNFPDMKIRLANISSPLAKRWLFCAVLSPAARHLASYTNCRLKENVLFLRFPVRKTLTQNKAAFIFALVPDGIVLCTHIMKVHSRKPICQQIGQNDETIQNDSKYMKNYSCLIDHKINILLIKQCIEDRRMRFKIR